MQRRTFLKYLNLWLLAPAATSLVSCGGGDSGGDPPPSNSGGTPAPTPSPTPAPTPTPSTTTLAIPPEVKPDGSNTINLQVNEGKTQFYAGIDSDTLGFVDLNNNPGTSYLGPTIRISAINPNSEASGTEMVNKGTQAGGANQVNFTIHNNTTGTTVTSHWHGVHIDGFVDGAGYNAIAPGATWSPTLAIYQQASTCWYHTHKHMETATNVYKGLAGLFIIDDTNSAALDAAGLPHTYGVDDIPLIVQDKVFNGGVMDSSSVGGRFSGDTFLVNGTINANLEVEAGLNRFRLLNASNSRTYKFYIESNSITGSFQHISTDGGFLSAPHTMSALRMAPGERNEIVIDFSAYNVGDVVSLRSDNLEVIPGTGTPFTVMTFTVVAQTAQTASNTVPATLNGKLAADRAALLANTVNAYVSVNLPGFGPGNPIATGRSTVGPATAANHTFDMMNKNFTSTSTQTGGLTYTEEWTITADRHPFHLHGCQVLLKSIGGDTNIPPELQGWKDTINMDIFGHGDSSTDSPMVFLVQFNERAYSAASNAGPGAGSNYMYMMHCHILGHEDTGMMGVFEVI